MKLRFLPILIVSLLLTTGIRSQTLQLHHADGTTTDLPLSSMPNVTFQEGKTLFTSSTSNNEYAENDILAFTYKYVKPDVNGDNIIDIADIASAIDIMAGAFGCATEEADVNGDGAVDVADIAELISVMAGTSVPSVSPSGSFSLGTGSIGEAFFIYRNDGHFNGFFRDEVDSIGFSHYDDNGLRYNKIAVQVIYTPDSIYRIPLALIDSVSFVQPEIIYKPGVRRVEDLFEKYLQKVDGLQLTFSTDMPKAEMPKPNEILLCLDLDTPFFEDGYAGKVLEVIEGDGKIVVECDSVGDITEIFQQFIAVENVKIDEEGKARMNTKKISDYFDYDLFTLDQDLRFVFLDTGDQELALKGHLGGGSNLKALYKITWSEQLVELTLTNTFDVGIGLNVRGELPLNTYKTPKLPLPSAKFPAWCPIFKCELNPALFFRPQVSASFDLSVNLQRKFIYTLSYHDGRFSGTSTKVGLDTDCDVDWGENFSIDGSVQAGVMLELYLGTVNILGMGFMGSTMDIYVGPKLSGTLDVNLKDISSLKPDYYNVFKDSKVSFAALAIDIEAKGKAKFFGKETKEHTFYEQSLAFFNYDFFLFPEFTDPVVTTYDDVPGSVSVSTEVSRKVIFPQKLGLGLFDSKGNVIQRNYDPRPFNFLNRYADLETSFSGLEPGEYITRPIINFLTLDIDASPATTFNTGSPVEITDFQVTKAQWKRTGFEFNGKNYPFKYNCDVTVKLNADGAIADWGYIYTDPDGNPKKITLLGKDHIYTDNSFAYCRDIPEASVLLQGYATYNDKADDSLGQQMEFPLVYDEKPQISFYQAEILETTADPKYDGDGNYLYTAYLTKFKYIIKINGGYFIDYIQPTIYDSGTWYYNGNKARVPADGMFAITTTMSYDNNSPMDWATGYNITLTDGTTITTDNYLQFSGTPESPTVTVTDTYTTTETARATANTTKKAPDFSEISFEEMP